jgi:1-acyl-sn-glycerol-3-phosphate acyltransferase
MQIFCFIVANLFYRIKVEGLSKIPKVGSVVLVCNHVTFIDWLILMGTINRPIRFVIHYSFMKKPLFRFVLKKAKVIPIAGRWEDKNLLLSAFDNIKKVMDDGAVICLFPEGKITYDGELNRFRPGIEKIVSDSPAPVVPIALKGLWGSFFSRKYGNACSNFKLFLKFKRREVLLQINEPILPSEANASKLEEIIRSMMTE